MHKDYYQAWEEYRERELRTLVPLLDELGFELEPEQPHTKGERYLMQAVTTTSGRKLILLGRRKKDGHRVVIKATSDAAGIQELEHERLARATLQKIRFAYKVFFSPPEVLFMKRNGYAVSIQSFIEQDRSFLARTLEEQFALALSSFKAQESAHAATYEHAKQVRQTFGSIDASGYLRSFDGFEQDVLDTLPDDAALREVLNRARIMLQENERTIQQYCGFLTHTDFVPHNIRIVGTDIYLLDHSSLRFGNKYEGWARFLNFMELYNPALASALVTYVKDNRTPEESHALRLMRIYRLGEILSYYTSTLAKSSGDLLALNRARIDFWRAVLEAVLNDIPLEKQVRDRYLQLRDSLRSDEEKQRQQGLH